MTYKLPQEKTLEDYGFVITTDKHYTPQDLKFYKQKILPILQKAESYAIFNDISNGFSTCLLITEPVHMTINITNKQLQFGLYNSKTGQIIQNADVKYLHFLTPLVLRNFTARILGDLAAFKNGRYIERTSLDNAWSVYLKEKSNLAQKQKSNKVTLANEKR